MKKIKLILIILAGIFINQPSLFAATVSVSVIEPTTNEWQDHFKLSDLVKWKPQDFQKITGKKMNFFEKIVFKMTQYKMRHYLKKHSDIKVAQFIEETEKKKSGFLWFVIGLLSPLIGVFVIPNLAGIILLSIIPILILYLTRTTKNQKTAFWVGTGIMVLLLLLYGIAAVGFSYW